MVSNNVATHSHKGNSSQDTSPVVELSNILSNDMGKVNALIIEEMQSEVTLIPKLAGYLIAAGGKRVRPLLTLASAALFTDDISKSYGLAAAVEFIHTATLLHDDVVDGSEERRGQRAANLVFGNDTSVLVGDFLFSRAFQLMVKSNSLEVLRILSNASAVIAEGEVLQLQPQGDLTTDKDLYYKVIGAKTAELFAAACEIGPVITGCDQHAKAMRDFGFNMGMAFQIADDVLDYQGDSKNLGKKTGDDFYDQKITLPVILAYQQSSDAEKTFWTNAFEGQSAKSDDFQTALSLIQKYKSCEESLKIAENFATDALNALATVKSDSPIMAYLKDMPGFLITRNS